VLARLHALDLQKVDAAFLDRPEHGPTPLDQHLNYQRSYYDWAREGVSYRILENVFDWLEAHRPDDRRRPVLNWGDARIGNILYRDFEPVAVLDWEMAAIGAPEVDLGWMLFMHRFFESFVDKLGLPGTPDFMQREDVVETYERCSGRPVRDLAFWEVFAGLRYAIVSLRTTGRAIAYEQMEPPENPEDRTMIRELLEQMLDGSYWSERGS
jgi:aminoglycoside phosphotransferase (APT) family kinase protein